MAADPLPGLQQIFNAIKMKLSAPVAPICVMSHE